MLSPHPSPEPAFERLADSRTLDRFIADFPRDLSPPTDDRPFFFMMDRDLLRGLLGYVTALTLAFIVLPVFLKAEPRVLRDNLALSLSFAALGLGFMLVEIAQMQRLIVLLGHPTFSLSVVLFGLLISSGAGSFVSGRRPLLSSLARRHLGTLVAVLAVVGLVTPPAVQCFSGIRHERPDCRGPFVAHAGRVLHGYGVSHCDEDRVDGARLAHVVVLGYQRRDVSDGQRAGRADFIKLGNLGRMVDRSRLLRHRGRGHRCIRIGDRGRGASRRRRRDPLTDSRTRRTCPPRSTSSAWNKSRAAVDSGYNQFLNRQGYPGAARAN